MKQLLGGIGAVALVVTLAAVAVVAIGLGWLVPWEVLRMLTSGVTMPTPVP